MALDLTRSELIARRYTRSRHALPNLGWGISGFVFLAPDHTAIKVHKRREQYETELAAYQRLRRLRIRSLHGVTIPRLRSWSDTDQIIRMDTVSPPFLLDFGGVLFEPPDFNEDVMAHWYATIEERYGSSAPLVHMLYEALAARGILLPGLPSQQSESGGIDPSLMPHAASRASVEPSGLSAESFAGPSNCRGACSASGNARGADRADSNAAAECSD